VESKVELFLSTSVWERFVRKKTEILYCQHKQKLGLQILLEREIDESKKILSGKKMTEITSLLHVMQ